MLPLRIVSLVLGAGLALANAAASAASGWDRIELRGVFDTEFAIQTRDGELQKWDIGLEPELRVNLGRVGHLFARGRFRIDPADELEPGQPDGQRQFRSPVSRRAFGGTLVDLELRELYLDHQAGALFLRLGKQQVVWGEADGLRVLDVVNPMHWREFLLPAFEDRRIPLWMVNAEWSMGSWTLQGLWIPDHTYDDLPEQDAVYAFTSPRLVPDPPAAALATGLVVFDDIDRPTRFGADDDYGLRLSGFTRGWDLSLNYLYHYQDQPVFWRESQPGGGVRYRPEVERTHLVGGSASNAFGDLVVRGEVAYSTDRFFPTTRPSDHDGVFESGELSYVLGVDYQYDADLRLSAQMVQSALAHRPSGARRDSFDTVFTLLAQREFLNDRVTASALALQSVNDGDGLVQLDLDYEWRSNIVWTLGADLAYGSNNGLFGEFAGTDRIRFGVSVGF